MRRGRGVAVLISMLLMVGGTVASPAAAKQEQVPGLPVELSLGDSWSFGFGAAVPSEGGYVARLHTALKQEFDCSPAVAGQADDGCKHLQLVNLAVPGATTPTLIAGQLPGAESLLVTRNGDRNPRNDVEVVTLHIGGNDVTNPILGACLGGVTPGCVTTINTVFNAYRGNLDTTLSRLRAAAGEDARIVIGTYDNGIANCFLGEVPGAVQLADVVLEDGLPPVVPEGLHDIMRDVAADHGVEVANAFGALGPGDWVGGGDCLHPVDSGYQKVADAFLAVLAG